MKVARCLLSSLMAFALLTCAGCGVSVRSPLVTSKSVTVPKTAAVRTADQAGQIALQTARTTLQIENPVVTLVRLMAPVPNAVVPGQYRVANGSDDAAKFVWLVEVDPSDQSSNACPAPPSGIDQTICWYAGRATIAISVSSGEVVSVDAPYPSHAGTPYVPSISVPASAELRTRQQAMAAGFKLVPGPNSKRPTIIEVRLLSAAEWTAWLERQGSHVDMSGVDAATPIWEMEFVDAALAQGCTPDNAATCVHDHLYLSLDALNGKNLGFLFPAAGAPANFTP